MKITAQQSNRLTKDTQDVLKTWVRRQGLNPENVRAISVVGHIGAAKVFAYDHGDGRAATRLVFFRARTPVPTAVVDELRGQVDK